MTSALRSSTPWAVRGQRPRRWRALLRPTARVACVTLLCGSIGAAAQEIGVGVEVRRDRLDYHFDNPSSFDTPSPVPHFFEQHYDADNVWLVVSARYGRGWTTRFGITPRRNTTADDYDTFFDPDGTVWVSGTTGPADVRSWSVEQWAPVGGRSEDRRHKLNLSVGYRLRLDTFDFGVGHKTLTRNGELVAATDATTRETTSSQLHQFLVAVDISRAIASGWRLSAHGDGVPLVLGRLVVRLPDKYPGQDLVFFARGFGASARVDVTKQIGAWTVAGGADAGRTWSYRSSDSVRLVAAGARLELKRSW